MTYAGRPRIDDELDTDRVIPTHINLTLIMTNGIHNSTYLTVACLDTNVDVAMWAEYNDILSSSQL